jgi:predicted MPP superfamily phosphohydrolase
VSLWPAFLAIDLGGLVLGVAWALKARRRGPLALALGLAALGMMLGLGALLVGIGVYGGVFAVLRLWCHVLFCVLAPLLVLAGLLLLRDRRRVPGLGALLLGLAMTAVYVHARRVEPFDLRVTRHDFRHTRLAGLEGTVRVVLLADLQTDEVGAYERDALERVDALEPDLLLLAGDYLHVDTLEAYVEQRGPLRELFRGLRHRPRLGILGVYGDTDPYADVLDGTDVRMLSGEVVAFPGLPLQVVGLSYEETFRSLDRRRRDAIEAFPGLSIVLGHRPDFVMQDVVTGSDLPYLAMAGHTHGGQVVIPFFGAPMTLSALPRRYASGFHRLGEAWLCVSRGVGMERLDAPRIRFLCPPELVVFDLAAP